MDSKHTPPDSSSRTIYRLRLNREKALAAAKYLLTRLGGEEKKHNFTALLKILFFADRYHIRKYIRPVTSDIYVVMKNGPVASFLYDVFKGVYPEYTDFQRVGWDVQLQTEPDFDALSESDIEALRFAIEHFGGFSYSKLISLSHEYPEWQRYQGRFAEDSDGHEPVYIEDFLAEPNQDGLKKLKFVDPYPEINEEEKQELLDDILEYSASIVPR